MDAGMDAGRSLSIPLSMHPCAFHYQSILYSVPLSSILPLFPQYTHFIISPTLELYYILFLKASLNPPFRWDQVSF